MKIQKKIQVIKRKYREIEKNNKQLLRFIYGIGIAILILIITASIVVLVPFLINQFVINNDYYSKAGNDGWASFWGSYLGGVFGGAGTLIAILSTRNQTKQVIRQNSNLIFNQTVIPKYEEIIRMCNDLSKEILNIRMSIESIKNTYENNKEKLISPKDKNEIYTCVSKMSQGCLKLNYNINMLNSFKVYINTGSNKDMMKSINDKIIEFDNYMNTIIEHLPKMSDNRVIIDIDKYTSCMENINNFLNILNQIDKRNIEIIQVKSIEIKISLQKILL